MAQPITQPAPAEEAAAVLREAALDDPARLIAWLREHPEIPLPYLELSLALDLPDGQGEAELARIADAAGEPVSSSPGGHGSVTKRFGAASYRAFHVPAAAMAAHDALQSYRGAVLPESETA